MTREQYCKHLREMRATEFEAKQKLAAKSRSRLFIPAIKQFSELKLSLNKLYMGADVCEGKPSEKSDSGEALLGGAEVDSECKTEGDDADSAAEDRPLLTFCSELDEIMH